MHAGVKIGRRAGRARGAESGRWRAPGAARALALALAAALVVSPLAVTPVAAEDVAAARAHFRAGQTHFAEGEYRAAIAEFAAADSLAVSPANEFNIALAYERLGERAEALRRYRLYLEKSPSAANRAAVLEAVAALERELKAAPGVAPPVVVAPDVAAPVPPGVPAPALPGVAAPVPPGVPAPALPGVAAPVPPGVPAPVPPGVAAPALPGVAAPVAAAAESEPIDPALARVAAIDVAALRDERRSTGEDAAAVPAGTPDVAAAPREAADRPEKKAKPLYKNWWLWVVVGVSALILLDIATSDSGDAGAQPRLDLEAAGMNRSPANAPALLRF